MYLFKVRCVSLWKAVLHRVAVVHRLCRVIVAGNGLAHQAEVTLFGSCILPYICSLFLTHVSGVGFQVTKQGNWMDAYERSATMILGVTSSVPSLPLPNVLLMANVTWPHGPFSTSSTPGAPVITLSR